eukprot:6186339-Pleurochrysis_carterae.AAC.4
MQRACSRGPVAVWVNMHARLACERALAHTSMRVHQGGKLQLCESTRVGTSWRFWSPSISNSPQLTCKARRSFWSTVQNKEEMCLSLDMREDGVTWELLTPAIEDLLLRSDLDAPRFAQRRALAQQVNLTKNGAACITQRQELQRRAHECEPSTNGRLSAGAGAGASRGARTCADARARAHSACEAHVHAGGDRDDLAYALSASVSARGVPIYYHQIQPGTIRDRPKTIAWILERMILIP